MITKTIEEYTGPFEKHLQWKVQDYTIDLYHHQFWGGRIIMLNGQEIFKEDIHFGDEGSTYTIDEPFCSLRIIPDQDSYKHFHYELTYREEQQEEGAV